MQYDNNPGIRAVQIITCAGCRYVEERAIVHKDDVKKDSLGVLDDLKAEGWLTGLFPASNHYCPGCAPEIMKERTEYARADDRYPSLV